MAVGVVHFFSGKEGSSEGNEDENGSGVRNGKENGMMME